MSSSPNEKQVAEDLSVQRSNSHTPEHGDSGQSPKKWGAKDAVYIDEHAYDAENASRRGAPTQALKRELKNRHGAYSRYLYQVFCK